MPTTHDYDPKTSTFVRARGTMPVLIIPDLPANELDIVQDYLTAGKDFGLLWSLPFLSALIVTDEHLDAAGRFGELEHRYQELGYQPISLAGFRDLAGFNKSFSGEDGVCVPLNEGAEAIFASDTIIRELTRLQSRA